MEAPEPVVVQKKEKPVKKCPKHCPMCGSTNLHHNLNDWFAHSLEPHDLENTAILTETQCEDCAIAFWM